MQEDKQPCRRSRLSGLISPELTVLSIAFLCIFLGGSIQPFIGNTASLPPTRHDLIIVTIYGSFMFWRIFVNYSVQKLGEKASILLGSITYTMFIAVLITRSFPLILAAAVLWGWGAASLWLVGGSRVLDASRKKRFGTSSGIFYASVQLGLILGYLILSNLGNRFGRFGMIIPAIAAAVAGNLVLLKFPSVKIERHPPSIAGIFRMMRLPQVKIAGFFLLFASFSYGILLSTFSRLSNESGVHYLGLIVVFYPVARFVLSLVGGPASDKLGRGLTLTLPFFLSGIGLIISSLFPHTISDISAAFFLGIQGGIVPVVATALIGDITVPTDRQLAYSAVFFWRDLGVVIPALLSNPLSRLLGGYRASFLAFGVVFILCTFLALYLARREKSITQHQ